MNNSKTFGEFLKDLRNAVGKTQGEVANEITQQNPENPMTQARLSYIENMETAPRQEILEILAAYYDVPISAFFQTKSKELENNRKSQIKSYLESLQNRNYVTIRDHTEDNSANDTKTISTIDNIRRWQSSYNENPEE